MRKKLIVIGIIAIAIAALSEMMLFFSSSIGYETTQSTEMTLQEKGIYPNQLLQLVAYQQEGNMLRTTGADPQIYLNTSNMGSFSKVKMNFSQPIEKEIPIQCFYEVNEIFTEENSIRTTCPADTTEYSFSIPEGRYRSIRIDMDESFIPLQSVVIEEYAPAIQKNGINFVRAILIAAGVFCLAFIVTWLRLDKRLKSILEKLSAWEQKNGYQKQWWILLIISVAFAFIFEIIQIRTQPKTYHYETNSEITANGQNIYSRTEEKDVLANYERTENGIKATGADPQIWLSIPSRQDSFSWVYFYFNKAVKEKLNIQVYYQADGILSEENSRSTICIPGVTFWAVEIPKGNYDLIRADIDGTEIPLETIAIGNIPAPRVPDAEKMHFVRVGIASIVLFCALLFLSWVHTGNRMLKMFGSVKRGIQTTGKRGGIYVLLFPLLIAIAILVAKLICQSNHLTFTWPVMVFAGVIGAFIASLLTFRKTLLTQPEYIFLVLVLCLGSLYSYFVPHTGINSWDEDYHFQQALTASYVDEMRLTPEDNVTINRSMPRTWDLNGGIQEAHNEMDLLYKEPAEAIPAHVSLRGLPETFNGIGLFFGRALGLRYYQIHALGRLFGVITYAIVGFFAVRKLRSGKMIAIVSLLIPTSVFLSGSYNYDIYLTAFMTLGICYYIAQWQNKNEKLTLVDAFVMIASLTFACLPKIVYFPILWITLFLPREKFAEKKHRLWFVLSVMAMTCVLLVLFVLTEMRASSGFSDFRGGSDINGAAQLKHIINNPFGYLQVIFNFFKNEYFNLDKAYAMLTNLAYHGIAPYSVVYLLILFITTFTDKNDYDQGMTHHVTAHVGAIVLSMAALILAVTALYVTFTPVGSDGINGAQFRYMIPAVFPILIHLGSGLVNNKMNRAWYNGLVFAGVAFVNFAVLYNGILCHYY